MRTQLCLLALLMIAVPTLIQGCGASSGVVKLNPGVTDTPLSTLSTAEALRQLDAMPVPARVDAQVFAKLKAAMRGMLALSPATKLTATPPTGAMNHISDVTSGVNDVGIKGIQWNYKNAGDYDFNSQVNLGDLVLVGINFGKTTSSTDWLSAARFADGDKNGIINVADVTPIGVNFLRRVAGYTVEGAAAAAGPYTKLGDVAFAAGQPLLTGIRMYHYTPGTPYEFYRVTPFDDQGVLGDPSDPSVDFMISEKTRIIGAAGGPSFVSRNGDNITVLLPVAEPSPIQPGDVVVGAEAGGYLLRVQDIQQVGTTVNVVGEPGILADVFLQGGLADALDDISQVPPEVYTLNLAGQQLCDVAGLQASILSGSVSFLPQADVAVNYNQYGGVTYLRGLALGGPLDLKMTAEVLASEWVGTFPPSSDEIPFFEHKMAGYTFDFTAYQNGVPVTMALQYDVYVGIRGTGTMHGQYIASVDSSYNNIKMGGIFNSRGTVDYNEYIAAHGTVGTPAISPYGGDFVFSVYVRPEIHTRLYGNPIPGNTEDLALTLGPQLTLTGNRATAPVPGYNYWLDGSMDTSYLLVLHHIGMDNDPQSKAFTGQMDTLSSGFISDITPPD